jgi:hypothetical protein
MMLSFSETVVWAACSIRRKLPEKVSATKPRITRVTPPLATPA